MIYSATCNALTGKFTAAFILYLL